jgi:hypothetical protein
LAFALACDARTEGVGEERNKGAQYGEDDLVEKEKLEIVVVSEQVRHIPLLQVPRLPVVREGRHEAFWRLLCSRRTVEPQADLAAL